MQFNVEAARAAGLSEEEIQAAIAAGPPPELTEEITTEEIVDIEAGYKRDIPEPPKENQQSSELTFDVERARDAGLTDIQIQEAIDAGPPEQQPTQQLTQQPTQPTGDKEYAGFFESAFGALGDYFDIASVGSSALLPGGETTDEAARRFLKESETK